MYTVHVGTHTLLGHYTHCTAQVSTARSWPGLGQSESFYSVAVTMFSIGEVVGALGAGKILQLFHYRQCFLCGLFLCVAGYLLYALTNAMHFWMILVARFVIGISASSLRAFEIAYIGETAEQEAAKQHQPEQKQHSGAGRCKRSKKTLKEKLFVIYSFASTLSFLIGPGMCLACDTHCYGFAQHTSSHSQNSTPCSFLFLA